MTQKIHSDASSISCGWREKSHFRKSEATQFSFKASMVTLFQIKQQKPDSTDLQSAIRLGHNKKNQKGAQEGSSTKRGKKGHGQVAKMWYCSVSWQTVLICSEYSMLCSVDKRSNHLLFVTPLKFYFHEFFHPSTHPTFSHHCLIHRGHRVVNSQGHHQWREPRPLWRSPLVSRLLRHGADEVTELRTHQSG